MSEKIISIKNCCGCGMCDMVCPTSAITMEYRTGFPLPKIDTSKCVRCGKCYDHCPTHMEFKENYNVVAYGGWSLNKENRNSSTSGGIAYEIASHLLEDGYKYMGVRFNPEKMCAESYTSDSIKELDASRGSKYTTSHTMPVLSELQEKSKWVVFGTPCQIAAIDNYARKNRRRDKFVLIDMFCAGPATEKLLFKYISEECNKDNKKLEDVVDVKFRDKSKYGWSSSMRIDYSDGSTNKIVDKSESGFYQLFYSGATAKDACYHCMYASNISYADIRLGDYSGKKYAGNKEGVSAILAFSKIGKNILNDLNGKTIYLEETTEEDINAAKLVKPKFKPRQRNKILTALDSEITLKELNEKYVKQIMFERKIKKKINQIFK